MEVHKFWNVGCPLWILFPLHDKHIFRGPNYEVTNITTSKMQLSLDLVVISLSLGIVKCPMKATDMTIQEAIDGGNLNFLLKSSDGTTDFANSYHQWLLGWS